MGRKLPGKHHEDRRRSRATWTSAIILPPQKEAVTRSAVAVGLDRLAAGHQRRLEPGGKQRRQVPADRRGADQHGSRLLGGEHFLEGGQIGLRRISGQLRIVDQHDAIGRAAGRARRRRRRR